jgi:hypothetical protein
MVRRRTETGRAERSRSRQARWEVRVTEVTRRHNHTHTHTHTHERGHEFVRTERCMRLLPQEGCTTGSRWRTACQRQQQTSTNTRALPPPLSLCLYTWSSLSPYQLPSLLRRCCSPMMTLRTP